MRARFGGAPGFVDLGKRVAMIPPPFDFADIAPVAEW